MSADCPAVLFFFFQAEDGIRDHCVTGVQTCALPICGKMAFSTDSALQHLQRAHKLNRLAHAYLISGPVGSGKSIVAARFAAALNKTTPGEVLRGQRSEERRVGKEWRSTWSPKQ